MGDTIPAQFVDVLLVEESTNVAECICGIKSNLKTSNVCIYRASHIPGKRSPWHLKFFVYFME
jgi:hypothetical protein